MKDLGNKMRDLGRYYEGFGETFAVAAIDMRFLGKPDLLAPRLQAAGMVA
jgi:hypothetical protein